MLAVDRGLARSACRASPFIDARQGWQRVSMGEGTKGARVFDWACLPVVHRGIDDQQHWMLIRRSVVDPTNLAGLTDLWTDRDDFTGNGVGSGETLEN